MYYGDGLNYYHNYNNITNMDMYSIVNINEAPYGNSIYLKDKIISDDKMKKHKRKVKSIDENLNQFLGLNNNFNIPNNRINYNYGMVQRNNSGLNNHISTNIKNDKQYRMYKNKNIFKENSTILNDKNNNIPYTYQRMYPKEKPNVTNNNYLNRNINNPNLNRGKLTLNNKKNLINKNNINIPVNINNNNKRQTYYLNQNRQNNQFQNNMNIQNEFNQRKVGVNNFLNNNKINININKNKKVNNNLVNNHETPNNILNSFKNYNNNNNQNNINKNTIKQKNDVINQIQQNKKRKIIENEQEEDDENFNDLVDDLYNFALKNKQKKKNKNKIPLNNVFQNNNKNKEDENVINNSIQLNIPPNRNKKQEYAECACQAEISKNSTHNSLKNENSVKKNEKIDIGIGIQESLLPMIQPNSFNDNEIQADIDKKIELKINHVNIINIINDKKQEIKEEIKEESEIKEKDFSLNNINYNNLNDDKDKEKSKEEFKNNEDIKQNKEEDNKNNNKGINNENEVALNNLNDFGGSIIKISQDIVIVNNQDDLKIGEEYDDSDDNKEEEKINKKRVAINLDNNFYFTFVKNDLIDLCQVRKGIKGSLEFFQPKTLEDDFDSHIVIQHRACIKPFKKNEIKIDENYQLRENMDETQIVPELYEDFEEGNEINENETQELASSLRGSIDKSTDININNSIKRSINQSYNQSMVGSLLMSTNNEGEGIIRKLKAAFEESVNREF